MRFRENLPLVVMSAVAVAIMIFFVACERSGHALQGQIEGVCGWSGNPAMAAAWPRVRTFQTASWNPAFPPSPPSPRPAQIGCMKSNTTGIG